MHLLSILAAISSLATSAIAGNTIVRNHCDSTIYILSTAQVDRPKVAIAPGGTFSEPQYSVPGIGTAIKIVREENGWYTGKPILILGYTLNHAEGSIYYSLESINGYAFGGSKVVLHASKPDAPQIYWESAPILPPNTKAYFGDTDLILDLCAQ